MSSDESVEDHATSRPVAVDHALATRKRPASTSQGAKKSASRRTGEAPPVAEHNSDVEGGDGDENGSNKYEAVLHDDAVSPFIRGFITRYYVKGAKGGNSLADAMARGKITRPNPRQLRKTTATPHAPFDAGLGVFHLKNLEGKPEQFANPRWTVNRDGTGADARKRVGEASGRLLGDTAAYVTLEGGYHILVFLKDRDSSGSLADPNDMASYEIVPVRHLQRLHQAISKNFKEWASYGRDEHNDMRNVVDSYGNILQYPFDMRFVLGKVTEGRNRNRRPLATAPPTHDDATMAVDAVPPQPPTKSALRAPSLADAHPSAAVASPVPLKKRSRSLGQQDMPTTVITTAATQGPSGEDHHPVSHQTAEDGFPKTVNPKPKRPRTTTASGQAAAAANRQAETSGDQAMVALSTVDAPLLDCDAWQTLQPEQIYDQALRMCRTLCRGVGRYIKDTEGLATAHALRFSVPRLIKGSIAKDMFPSYFHDPGHASMAPEAMFMLRNFVIRDDVTGGTLLVSRLLHDGHIPMLYAQERLTTTPDKTTTTVVPTPLTHLSESDAMEIESGYVPAPVPSLPAPPPLPHATHKKVDGEDGHGPIQAPRKSRAKKTEAGGPPGPGLPPPSLGTAVARPAPIMLDLYDPSSEPTLQLGVLQTHGLAAAVEAGLFFFQGKLVVKIATSWSKMPAPLANGLFYQTLRNLPRMSDDSQQLAAVEAILKRPADMVAFQCATAFLNLFIVPIPESPQQALGGGYTKAHALAALGHRGTGVLVDIDMRYKGVPRNTPGETVSHAGPAAVPAGAVKKRLTREQLEEQRRLQQEQQAATTDAAGNAAAGRAAKSNIDPLMETEPVHVMPLQLDQFEKLVASINTRDAFIDRFVEKHGEKLFSQGRAVSTSQIIEVIKEFHEAFFAAYNVDKEPEKKVHNYPPTFWVIFAHLVAACFLPGNVTPFVGRINIMDFNL